MNIFLRMRRYVSSLLVLILALLSPMALAQEATQIVRVGYVDLPGFYFNDINGCASGYAYDLMCELSQYTGKHYEFIKTTGEELVLRLNSGELDLGLALPRSADLFQQLAFANQVFCDNQVALLVPPASDIAYGDYESMRGITVGAFGSIFDVNHTIRSLQQRGATVTLRTDFDSSKAMYDALSNKEIDAVLSDTPFMASNYRIAAFLGHYNLYAVASKAENAALAELDTALQTLQRSNSFLLADLSNRYLIANGDVYPSLTRNELTFIRQDKPVTICMSVTDIDENGNPIAPVQQILHMLAQKSGLRFEPVTKSNSQEVLDALASGEVDAVLSFAHDYDWAKLHNAYITSPFSQNDTLLVKRHDMTAPRTMAVVKGSYIAYQAERNKEYELRYYDGLFACFDAVLSGKADLLYSSAAIGAYYSANPKYSPLSFLYNSRYNSEYCIAVSKNAPALLFSILNKAVVCIPSDTINAALDAQVVSRSLGLMDFFYSNPALAALLLSGLIFLIVLVIVLLKISAIMRKKNAQLLAATHAKNDFLRRISHDIRTPLNAIICLSHLARTSNKDHAADGYLNQIRHSSDCLLLLINEALDFNTITSNAVTLHAEPLSLDEALLSITTFVQYAAKPKNIDLELELPVNAPVVMLDKLRFNQVCLNIMSNAINFTPENGRVKLTYGYVFTKPGMLEITFIVSDTGIGMAESFLPCIFEPFAKEERGESQGESGAGLGMSIAKEVLDAMHGAIAVESRVARGTTVTVHIPAAVASLLDLIALEQSKKTTPTSLRGKRVLLVEDNQINMEVCKSALENEGVLVEQAQNGQVAFEQFAASSAGYYDAVLMDVHMPVMDGLESTRRIRALPRGDAETIPIIALTADAFLYERDDTITAGMNEHLSKPVEPSHLFQVLTKWTGSQPPSTRSSAM